MQPTKTWTLYLAGEIHTPWRDEIAQLAKEADLPIQLTGPVIDHDASDAAGDTLGPTPEGDGTHRGKTYWRDQQSASVNAIRTRTLLAEADIVVVRFGDKYKQWNAAFDAGLASAMNKPLIILHNPDLTHALKEIDAAANAVAQTPQQVVHILKYLERLARFLCTCHDVVFWQGSPTHGLFNGSS